MSVPVAAMAVSEWIETAARVEPYDQVNVSVSGSVVVWQDYRNKQQVPPNAGTGCPGAQNCTAADIYALDLNGGAERRLTTTFNGLDPDVSGSRVAWRNWDTGRIVVYDLTNDSSIDVSTVATQMVSPSISGNRVVWVDYRNSTEYGDIYMRDITAPADGPISLGSNLPAGKTAPQKDKRSSDIDGDIVVWEDMRNAFQDAQGWWHNPDIYMKNLATGVEEAVCTNVSDQYNPVVAGNRIYWMDYRNNNWDVYMKDISTGIETRLTVNNSHQSWPSASGEFVAWKDTREGDEDIYIRNLVNGVEQRVNTDPVLLPAAGQKMPVISGSRVAWMDNRYGNWDILTARDEVAPQVESVTPSGLLSGNTAAISASYADGGTGADTSTVAVIIDGLPMAGCTATAIQVDCPSNLFREGNHTTSVHLDDHSGNHSNLAEARFFVDTIAPVINISTLVPEGTNTAVIDASMNDPAPGSGINQDLVQVTLDGLAQSGCLVASNIYCNFAGLTLGDHSVGITATDMAGNSSTSTRGFQVADTVAPVITTPDPVGSFLGDSMVLRATFSDDLPSSGIDPAAVSVAVDGVEIAGCSVTESSLSCPFSSVADGNHQILASVTDKAGNIGSLAWSINVNGGPEVTILEPAAGAVVNNPTTPVAAAWSDAGDGIDEASVRVYLDNVSVEPPGILLAAGSFGFQPGWSTRLADGTHSVRVVVADLKGAVTDHVWSFTVTSPAPVDSAVRIYWENYMSYLKRELSVDFHLTDSGTGPCRYANVISGTASDRILAEGFPVALGEIASGDFASYTIRYSVPAGVSSFMALNRACCTDDAGNTYWTPGLPPF